MKKKAQSFNNNLILIIIAIQLNEEYSMKSQHWNGFVSMGLYMFVPCPGFLILWRMRSGNVENSAPSISQLSIVSCPKISQINILVITIFSSADRILKWQIFEST